MTHPGTTLLSTLALVLSLLLTFSCHAVDKTSVMDKTDRATARQFEIAIAEAIIQDILRDYPALEESHRADYLHQKFAQLQRSVNFQLVNAATRRQRDLLAWLLAREEKKSDEPPGYLSKLNRLTSLHWSLPDYEKAVTQDAARLDLAIKQQNPVDASIDSDINPAINSDINSDINPAINSDINSARQAVLYPEDTIQGRQDYLDRLAKEMTNSQFRWHAAPKVYPKSSIGFAGVEDASSSWIFVYEQASGTLRINLSDVRSLPWFELPSVAIYYGFPGLHSLHDATLSGASLQKHLQQLLHLPGLSLGWAAYIAEFLITGESGGEQSRDPAVLLEHLYFQRLLTGLALVDLRLHASEKAQWTDQEALAYLLQTTPYGASRLGTMVREVRSRPGDYLAALAGKKTFTDLHNTCLQKSPECEITGLHQTIISIGTVPFELLYDTLGL